MESVSDSLFTLHYTIILLIIVSTLYQSAKFRIYINKTRLGVDIMMIGEIEARAAKIAEYLITTGATVRAAAKHFGISKSTVHTAVTLSNALCGWWRKNV